MKQTNDQAKIIITRAWHTSTLRLSVNRRGQIVLRMPMLCSKKIALAFLEKHQDWIAQQQEKNKSSLIFQNDMTITILGQEVQIHHTPDWKGGTTISNGRLIVGGEPDFIHRRVQDFIKHKTRLYIDKKARETAQKIGMSINKITLKDTVSRWGSCSGKKNLNFCWRLGLAPLYVLDYIIAHEVAHLQEMNHSQRFWRVVATLCQDRSTAEIWLRRHGHTLR